MKIFIFIVMAFILAVPVTGYAQGDSSPVVVELFSSQGCPACPPADKYLGQLAKAQSVIALSCHVDYFDVLNDTLGKYLCTKRQAVYMHQQGQKTMFTPQMMINGHLNAVGNKTEDVALKIGKGRAENVSSINIVPKAAGVFNFTMPQRTLLHPVSLLLAVYDRPHDVSRRGRKTTYYNVINHIMPLGEWRGTALERAVFPVLDARHAGFAILAQDMTTGQIVAAGDYKL